MNKYIGDALHTDLYQINMGYVYFKDGIHERKSYLMYISERFHLVEVTLYLQG